jgi:hypothetical protein
MVLEKRNTSLSRIERFFYGHHIKEFKIFPGIFNADSFSPAEIRFKVATSQVELAQNILGYVETRIKQQNYSLCFLERASIIMDSQTKDCEFKYRISPIKLRKDQQKEYIRQTRGILKKLPRFVTDYKKKH